MKEELIQDEIDFLEGEEFSYSNVGKLATLYIVREHLRNGLERPSDAIQGELNDLTPSYKRYRKAKRRYQLNEATQNAQIEAMGDLCREITEFIRALYSGSESVQERYLITKMIHELKDDSIVQ